MRQKRSHLSLLLDVGELAALIRQSTDTDNFLDRTARMVSEHLGAEVCSIYLVDPPSGDLVLKATVGLNPAAVGQIRMKPGIGLVGTTMETLGPVLEGRAPQNPKFKYFKEAHEERFQSFLAVPIHRGANRIGVLVVQHEQPDYFDDTDVRTLKAMAAQLIGALEGALVMIDLNGGGPARAQTQALEHLSLVKGEIASPGFAFGPVTIRRTGPGLGPLAENRTAYSIDDLHRAIADTAAELAALQQQVARRLPESAALFFEAHLLMLKDAKFIGRIKDQMGSGAPAAGAVAAAAHHYMDLFGTSTHAYLREKADDVADLARRLLKNLVRGPSPDTALTAETILVARMLYPSDILKGAADNIKGIVLVGGGTASHVAILARSLAIPIVMAQRPELLDLPEATPLLLDADLGNIYVNPSSEIIKRFEQRNRDRDRAGRAAKRMVPETFTKDGQRVHLIANINLLGVDRNNPAVRDYFRAEHPAVLRALARIVAAARAAGKDIAVCGEMAHETAFIPFFIGIRVRRLSADPHFLPDIQAIISGLSIGQTQDYAAKLLACASLEQTGRVIREYAGGSLIADR